MKKVGGDLWLLFVGNTSTHAGRQRKGKGRAKWEEERNATKLASLSALKIRKTRHLACKDSNI